MSVNTNAQTAWLAAPIYDSLREREMGADVGAREGAGPRDVHVTRWVTVNRGGKPCWRIHRASAAMF